MFALFRPHPNDELARIGEAHLKQDLSPDDRARLRTAASRVTNYTTVGSLLGLGLGAAMAYRIHTNRVALYNAFKMVNRPVEVIFPNGRRGAFLPLSLCVAGSGELICRVLQSQFQISIVT